MWAQWRRCARPRGRGSRGRGRGRSAARLTTEVGEHIGEDTDSEVEEEAEADAESQAAGFKLHGHTDKSVHDYFTSDLFRRRLVNELRDQPGLGCSQLPVLQSACSAGCSAVHAVHAAVQAAVNMLQCRLQ
eukprot:jgi/Tetstr1/426581/TSEL_016859.t1